MKFNNLYQVRYSIMLMLALGSLPGCKQSQKHHTPHKTEGEFYTEIPLEDQSLSTPEQTTSSLTGNKQPPLTKSSTMPGGYSSENPDELDYDVENTTGKTIFVTGFTWLHRRDLGHWRWDKSPVYRLEPGQIVTVDISTVTIKEDLDKIFGYLAVFNTYQEAADATIELLGEKNLLDLDQLMKLKGKKVTIDIEKYGRKRGKDVEYYEYDFVKKEGEAAKAVKLDFAVENLTGKTILITCFVYQKKAKGSWIAALEEKDDMTVWRYDKTPLIKLLPKQIGIIDVDPIVTERDREYVRGYLAVFDEDEEEKALNATFEMLPSKYKLTLGELFRLKNKKVVLDIEEYGIQPKFIDFVPRKMNKIDFTKIYGSKEK